VVEPAVKGKQSAGEDRVGGSRDREGGETKEAGKVT
jgi:hypothetical protein